MTDWNSPIFGNGLAGGFYILLGIAFFTGIPVISIIRHIGRKKAGDREKESDAMKEMFRSFFEGCLHPVMLVSQKDGSVVDGNASLWRWLGRSRKDLEGSGIGTWIASGESSESRDALKRFLGGEPIETDQLLFRGGNGSMVPVSLKSAPIADPSGDHGLIQVILEDLSGNRSLQERLSKREKMLAAYGVMARLLHSGDDTPARFVELVQVIGEVMKSDSISILFLDPAAEVVSGFKVEDGKENDVQRVSMGLDENSIVKCVILNRKPMWKSSLSEGEGSSEETDLYRQGFRSYLVLPLILRDQAMGTLNVLSRSPGAIHQDDVEILGHIASHLTLGINNIQLQREAEKKAQRLKQILVTSNSFRLQVFLDDLLKEIVWSIRFSTGFNFVALSMLNSESMRVEIKAMADNDKDAVKRLIGTTYTWETFQALMKEEQKISHSYLVNRDESVLAKIKELGSGSGETAEKRDGRKKGHALFVPIETRLGKIVGFLLVDDSRESDDNTLETVQTMEIFANEVAVVIDNQRLFEEAKKKSEELQSVNEELQDSKASLENAKRLLEESNKELEKVNAELREVDKLKAEFLQNVTHELRTPLAPIMVNSEVLLLKKIGALNPVQEEIVQSVFQSAKRLNSLIDDLLDLTKMESGKMRFQFTMVSPDSLVNNSLVETYPFGREKNITITKSIECRNLHIYGDSSRLIQLLTNLIRNAVKFTHEGGRVDLVLRNIGTEKIELKVADTGVGIPASKLGKIFDRFFQVDGSATRKYKGAGLGLSIVKKIVEAHQGEIHVESQEGVGSVFTVILPARPGGVEREDSVRSL